MKALTNTFIYLLEKLPRIDKSQDKSFRNLLMEQIELLDPKFQRIANDALKAAFETFKKDIEMFMFSNMEMVNKRLR